MNTKRGKQPQKDTVKDRREAASLTAPFSFSGVFSCLYYNCYIAFFLCRVLLLCRTFFLFVIFKADATLQSTFCYIRGTLNTRTCMCELCYVPEKSTKCSGLAMGLTIISLIIRVWTTDVEQLNYKAKRSMSESLVALIPCINNGAATERN